MESNKCMVATPFKQVMSFWWLPFMINKVHSLSKSDCSSKVYFGKHLLHVDFGPHNHSLLMDEL